MIANRPVLGALALGVAFAMPAAATTITIVNNDGVGEGFNDLTLVTNTNAGCNIGETLGACRLRVFQTAADQWEVLLNSSVEIRVRSQMDPQTCSGTSAVLGSAGAISTAANFTGAPRANTSYNIAEANSLAGTDLDGVNDDINATFNISIDTGCLTNTTGWWYGIDPAVAIPTDRIGLLPVVFHELGHGLGFTSNTNTSTGAYFTSQPPVWSNYLYDTETAKLWKNMTNAERQASAINDPDLVWAGPRTNKQAAAYIQPGPALLFNSPVTLPTPNPVGSPVATAANGGFGAAIVAPGTTADFVPVNDGVLGAGTPAGTATDGCETPFVNAAAVAGKIAFVDRGFCTFAVKAKNAQLNGAIGVVIGNVAASTNPESTIGMSGADATVTIPAVQVPLTLANSVRTAMGAGTVNGTIGVAKLSLRQGCIRMYAPNPVQSGSSVSHFHTDAAPDLLMEPSIGKIFNKVDLTLPLLKDIDWSANYEDFLFIDNFDANACANVQP